METDTSPPVRTLAQKQQQISKETTIYLRNKHVGRCCQLFYKEEPLKIVRAKGQYMYDEEGKEYLDCINNVCHVGHCHPHVVEVGQKQLGILSTNSRFLHDNIVLYAQRLVNLFPPKLNVVFFVNSGSEANDLALRMARAHTGSKEVITLDHAYHGHVISLINISPYKFNTVKDGEGCPPETHVVPVPDTYRGKYRDCDYPGKDLGQLYADEVKQVCDNLEKNGKHPGCFIAESLQSCGGQIIYPPGYLREVYRTVRGAGGICIADEVQVGFGRVGTSWWAFETQGTDICPDIVTIGKPMGNGHPVAAVVVTEEVAKSFDSTGMTYFNTYGGNPVSCAIAGAVLDVIEDEKLLEHATKIGAYLLKGFQELYKTHPMIGDVRGTGMFIGVDIVKDRQSRKSDTKAANFIVDKLKQNNILLQTDGPCNNVLKFKSPLCFNKGNADRLLSNIDKLMTEWEAGRHQNGM